MINRLLGQGQYFFPFSAPCPLVILSGWLLGIVAGYGLSLCVFCTSQNFICLHPWSPNYIAILTVNSQSILNVRCSSFSISHLQVSDWTNRQKKVKLLTKTQCRLNVSKSTEFYILYLGHRQDWRLKRTYEIAYARAMRTCVRSREVVILLQEQDHKHHCRTTCALKDQMTNGTSWRTKS